MKKIYAPWRSTYTKNEAVKSSDNDTQDVCVFCTQLKQNEDEKYYILRRFHHCTVILNLYPYNAGHLLILSNDHVSTLSNMASEGRIELVQIMSASVDVLKKALQSHGTNIGANLGKASGAGIPTHLHFHVLPRWQGDTNYMPTIAETKVISFDLNEIYSDLKPYFEKIQFSVAPG